jgi:hypothetical protein
MEFVNRKACIEHYQDQFPNLPRYMIEMALDYDLAQGEGSASNEKPMTGKQKRQQKQQKKGREPVKRELNQTIQDALKTGKRIEIDCAQVVKAEDYEMPPFIKGHIGVDGVKLMAVAEQIQDEPEPEPLEEIAFDNDF